MDAKPGERVRFYFVNAGPNNVSAVHPIAEIWDDVWESGNPANHTRGVQTQLIPPAGAAILDMVLDNNDGVYPIVTHSLTDALRGAIALLKVDKDARQLPLVTPPGLPFPSAHQNPADYWLDAMPVPLWSMVGRAVGHPATDVAG